MEVQDWNQEFWAAHNTQFSKVTGLRKRGLSTRTRTSTNYFHRHLRITGERRVRQDVFRK